MLKKVTKKLFRKTLGVIRLLKNWAEEPVDVSRKVTEDSDLAYLWLNSLLTQIVQDAPRIHRPNYAWGVLQAAHLAKALGMKQVSVIEFGVAGGNGLVALDRIAEKVETLLGVNIHVYGFDTGVGLPKPTDYRDLPSLWVEGAFPMDVGRLKKRLTRAELVLGPVEKTLPAFLASNPAPVGFISFDLDYYSSTMQAFKLLEADRKILLPRIYCYFDDILGHIYSDFTGERLAIREFNAAHPMRKISPMYGLKHFLPKPHDQEEWAEMIYLVHMFDHPLYSVNDGLVKPARHRTGGELNADVAELSR
jgi:hypothetical protein